MEIRFEFPRCLSESEQSLHGTDFEHFVQRYVISTLAIFGILGNILNLSVLLRSRRRSNVFLAVLAFADVVFLLLLLPHAIMNFNVFTFNYAFRYAYYLTRFHCLALSNCCSAVAVWCVIAVSAERLHGIRNPLYVRKQWSTWRMPLLLLVIVASSLFSSAYVHFERTCLTGHFCNGTQLYQVCRKVTEDAWFKNQTNPYSMPYRRTVKGWVFLHVTSMILLPIILLSVLNILLVLKLRGRQKSFKVVAQNDVTPLRLSVSDQNANLMSRTEQSVTFMVARIVTAFTLANTPSAFFIIVRTAYDLPERYDYDLTIICNVLVVAGKVSNFVLFCLSSRHFRKQLTATLSRRTTTFTSSNKFKK